MRGHRPVVALLTTLLLAVAVAQPALGHVTVETSGRTGPWVVADSASTASLRCTYEDHDLARLNISPPQIRSQARRARTVGWQFQVWRAKWWMTRTGQWHLAHTSDIAKARATRSAPASFAARQWTIPDEWRTAYDSVKVRLILRWYARNGTTHVGATTIELEYHAREHVGESIDPTTIAGHCTGSLQAPERPDPGTIVDGPPGLARMSHWQPYWRKFSEARVESTIAELTRMHQTGVILTGMESRNQYALPPNVAHYLGMFREAGIKPYLALWVGRFSDAELSTSLRAWEAGAGQWAGIVLDVERGLEVFAESDRSAAVTAIERFMARIRPLTSFVAHSTFAIPSDHPHMPYSELNALTDAFMPQLYFSLGSTGLYLMDRMQASVDFEASGWSKPPIPIVPVVNDWGNGVNLRELLAYIEISFARYGAVSGWRLHPNMREDVKDLWGSFAP